jgi:Lrp/AsnC family leucine-responsive transcriptional regulator
MIKLDLKDRKILAELDRNSRQSNSEISRKVRLNKNTVNYKIKRMEDDGLILGYYSIIDYSRLGFLGFRVYVNFFNSAPENETEIISWLKENKKVGVVTRVETSYDFAFITWVRSFNEFDEFWLEFKKKFRSFFWKERVYPMVSVHYLKRKYLVEAKNYSYEVTGNSEKEDYDELDFKILRILSKNARANILDLAEKLKTPERTIAFRIKQLEKKKIIQGYVVNLNLSKMGYEYYKLNCVLNSMENYDSLFRFSLEHPNVTYINRTLSELDLEIDIEVKNRQEMLSLIKKLKEKFNIREIEIAPYKEYYKIELMPEESF